MSDRIDNLVHGFIEVTLPAEDNFLLIKETLTRIGIPSNKEKKLYQSCHILHKKGKYYICHFKELFALDGKASSLDETDISRRNTIAKLLHDWELCDIVGVKSNGSKFEDGVTWPETMSTFIPVQKLKILSHKEKHEWDLQSKYSIGKKTN
jgi:hypothetical protein